MKMVTTCPACGTAFRIHRNQIDARGGQVRCGHCTVVFDANMYLEVEAELPPPMDIGTPDEPVEATEAVAAVSAQAQKSSTAAGAEPEENAEPLLLEEFGFRPKRARSAAARLFLGFAALCLSLLLVGQLSYYFRSELAIAVPQSQSILRAACEPLACVIPLPQRADFISIEADEMQLDQAHPELLTLSAVLRNRAGFDQAYPDIELTLTDEAQVTVARRILQPADYLKENPKHSTAFAANSEIAVKLHIQATGLGASGYRMEVLYL